MQNCTDIEAREREREREGGNDGEMIETKENHELRRPFSNPGIRSFQMIEGASEEHVQTAMESKIPTPTLEQLRDRHVRSYSPQSNSNDRVFGFFCPSSMPSGEKRERG